MPTNRTDQRQYHYFYKTTCFITGKYYFGIHSTDDLNDPYIGSGTLPSRKLLRKHERVEVDEEQIKDPMCMNLVLGGFEPPNALGRKRTEETKLRLSLSHKGKRQPLSAETKRKIGLKHRGKVNSPEARAKMSQSLKGRIPWNAGLTKEPDARLALKGQRLSDLMCGRTKKTHEYIKENAEKLRGRTKENHAGIAAMSQKMKRPWSKARREAFERSKKSGLQQV